MVAAFQQNQQFGLTPMQMHLVSMLNFNRTEAAEQRLKAAFNILKESAYPRVDVVNLKEFIEILKR